MRDVPKKPGSSVSRRSALAFLVACGGAGARLGGVLGTGCVSSGGPGNAKPLGTGGLDAGAVVPRPAVRKIAHDAAVELWSVFDLPDDPRSRELSGLCWEAATRTFWAVQDERKTIIPLQADDALKRWTLGPPIPLDVPGPLDLEGIAATPSTFLLVSELGPRLIEVDRQGKLLRDHKAPSKFAEALKNKSFESLALDPSRTVLYTTSETALPRDGAAITSGTGPRVRIVRIDIPNGEVTERAYATDEAVVGGGDYGVADLAAIDTDDLLVLERGFRKGAGNLVRIYRVDLTDSASICQGIEALSADARVLPKTLVVDLSKLPTGNMPPARAPQLTPLMENYEGMTLGPVLPDGRQSLVLVSDDNGRASQTPRVVVLAIR